MGFRFMVYKEKSKGQRGEREEGGRKGDLAPSPQPEKGGEGLSTMQRGKETAGRASQIPLTKKKREGRKGRLQLPPLGDRKKGEKSARPHYEKRPVGGKVRKEKRGALSYPR